MDGPRIAAGKSKRLEMIHACDRRHVIFHWELQCAREIHIEFSHARCLSSSQSGESYVISIEPSLRFSIPDHIVPGGTDKSSGGDYENRLQYVKFGVLAILKQ